MMVPTKDPNRGVKLGKDRSDCDTIVRLLKTMSADKLESIMRRYIKECTEQKVYMKYLGTFLHHLPDYDELDNEEKEKAVEDEKARNEEAKKRADEQQRKQAEANKRYRQRTLAEQAQKLKELGIKQ